MNDPYDCRHPVIPEHAQFQKLGEEVKCIDCGKTCSIEYDEWYDGERDEWGYFWLLPLDKKE
jgi:hypothetical protein